MKKLLKYINKQGYNYCPWASENEISPAVVGRYLRGHNISIQNIAKISKATQGKLSIEALIRDMG
jgi:hypothetical protein